MQSWLCSFHYANLFFPLWPSNTQTIDNESGYLFRLDFFPFVSRYLLRNLLYNIRVLMLRLIWEPIKVISKMDHQSEACYLIRKMSQLTLRFTSPPFIMNLHILQHPAVDLLTKLFPQDRNKKKESPIPIEQGSRVSIPQNYVRTAIGVSSQLSLSISNWKCTKRKRFQLDIADG